MIGTITAGVIILPKRAFRYSEIKQNMTLETLESLPIWVKYVEDGEGWNEAAYKNFCESDLKASEECEDILKVIPTGNLYVNGQLILEEAKVEQVIKGSCRAKTIWLANGLLCTLEYEKDKVILDGMNRSFMQKNCEYLVFVEALSANPYSEKQVYTEYSSMWNCCYNLTWNSTELVNSDGTDYNPKIEFYVANQKVLECYNKTKKLLIEKWIKQ